MTTTIDSSTGKTPWVFYGILFGILGTLSILAWGPIGVSAPTRDSSGNS